MKINRKIIEIDEELCDGCGMCVPACAEGAIEVIDGKAKVLAEKFCDGLGACLGECPQGALSIVEREADEFDEEAVAQHLEDHPPQETPVNMCPSARLHTFADEPAPDRQAVPRSALGHWPIQIRLVPPEAPFLHGSELVVIADCTAVAYPGFHQEFIQGKTLLMGCPKFDDRELYKDKFTAIFKQAGLKQVTVVVMEVPCCHGMEAIVREALKTAAVKVPLEIVTISIKGEIIKREKNAA